LHTYNVKYNYYQPGFLLTRDLTAFSGVFLKAAKERGQ